MFFKHGTMYHSHSIIDFDSVSTFFKKFKKTGFDKVKITCEAAQEVVYSKKYSPNDNWEDVFQHIR